MRGGDDDGDARFRARVDDGATTTRPLSLDDDDDDDDEIFHIAFEAAKKRKVSAVPDGVLTPRPSANACESTPETSYGGTTKSTGGKKSKARVLVEDGDVRAFVSNMSAKPQCVGVKWLDRREEDNTSPPDFEVDGTLAAVLARCGTPRLYSHQSAAIKAARSGRSVVVSTPTASGKSICYVVPIFEAIMDERSKQSKALLMFPLKALANDQLHKMRRVVQAAQEFKYEIDERMKKHGDATAKAKKEFMKLNFPDIDMKRLERLADAKLAVCDGDTDEAAKKQIKSQGTQIILTNPDSLHHAMLPGHRTWGKKFWGSLRYIVLDEAHTHTGVSGSHVANVLRRLLRVCASWDPTTRPEFICTSATISNPVQHIRRLTTRTPVCVDISGAPSGEKAMILWQPPESEAGGMSAATWFQQPNLASLSGEDASGTQRQRRSPYAEAADIVADLVRSKIRCLVFVSARTLAETVSRDAKANLAKKNPELASKVDSYRAGYNQIERRKLERRLQNGEISALVCTSALEMGIDVGSLDATVHVGVSETASAMWQQAGRAGRRRGASVAIVIACERPLDYHYVTRPGELFERQSEEALVDPHNSAILEIHLPCAAKEVALDLRGDDAVMFTASRDDAAPGMTSIAPNFKAPLHLAIKRALGSSTSARTCVFNKTTKTIECAPNVYPHRSVMLRGVQSGEAWKLLESPSGSLVEEIEGHRALARLYVGCVFIARRKAFIVQRLDIENRIAHAAPYEKFETTQTRERTEVEVLAPDPEQGVGELVSKNCAATRVHLGDIVVSEKVLGYARSDHKTGKLLHEEIWKTPVIAAQYRTRAVFFNLPDEVVNRRVAADALREATNGVANVCGGLVASIAMCDTRDVAGATQLPNPNETGPAAARIFLYDTTPGGIGIAEKVFENCEELWRRALETLKSCGCASGCPSCVQAGRRGRDAGFAKRDSKIVLDGLLGTWLAAGRG